MHVKRTRIPPVKDYGVHTPPPVIDPDLAELGCLGYCYRFDQMNHIINHYDRLSLSELRSMVW
jgi:hypothetical protein